MDRHADTGASLETHWSVDTTYASVAYRVANAGHARLVVFDRLFHTQRSGARTVDPDLAWRRIDAGGVLVVEKLVPPLPEDEDVGFPKLPYARVLEPGNYLEGRVVLPLPVTLLQPYAAPPIPAQDTVHDVALVLGYAVADDAMAARPIAAGDETVLSLDFGWAKPRQRLLRTVQAGITLPLGVGPIPGQSL